MRFTVTKDWSKNKLLRLILVLYAGFVWLFLIVTAMLFFSEMGLNPDTVVTYYLGEVGVEFGQQPRPYSSMLQSSHQHLFSMGLLVMVMTHLLLFLPVNGRIKASLVVVTFASTLTEQLSGWLVRYVSPHFAWLKIGSVLVMEICLLSLTAMLLVGSLRKNTKMD